ncbi:PorT family protein [Membranicola marinus]|uniref:PorT family protein n=1 Tax=Membranihabitans marinus TaxID=1227546 RepID=A0A953HRU0_9BACT|nr:porin family protein [Membranihabitans marinus]MBY5957111.1 PorT family protein [Membranihabitans marinus]
MKKIILSVCMFVALGVTAQAQADFIIKAGLHSVLSSESEINSTNVKGGRVGWNLGADFRFGNILFLQPGAHFYSSSLSLEAADGTVTDFKESARLQSLKVPLMVGLSPFSNAGGGNFEFVINAGVVPTFNLGIKDENDFIKNDDVKDVNWSGKVGAGLEFGVFVVGVDYEFGFNKILDDAESNFSIIGATVGLKF